MRISMGQSKLIKWCGIVYINVLMKNDLLSMVAASGNMLQGISRAKASEGFWFISIPKNPMYKSTLLTSRLQHPEDDEMNKK